MKRHLLLSSWLIFAAVGCAIGPKAPVPQIARRGDVVAEGSGQLSFRAAAPGLLSIYDVNANSVISSTPVRQGTLVVIDPSAGSVRVTEANVSGSEVINSGVQKSHRHELWFIAQDTSTTQWSR